MVMCSVSTDSVIAGAHEQMSEYFAPDLNWLRVQGERLLCEQINSTINTVNKLKEHVEQNARREQREGNWKTSQEVFLEGWVGISKAEK